MGTSKGRKGKRRKEKGTGKIGEVKGRGNEGKATGGPQFTFLATPLAISPNSVFP